MADFNKDYYVTRLRKMIECETVSKKDSFAPDEFMRLRSVMKELFPLVHEKAEKMYFSDDCWVYKIEGTEKNDNILLMSHHDVVEAEGEWKYPPFSCEEHDGKLWGRGVFDTKTSLFAFFQAAEELLSTGFEPSYNLWLASSHNEERCGDGIPKAVEYFKENNINFTLVLDEGGAITEPPVDGVKCGKCAMVGIHEKGRVTIECEASDTAGYGDMTKPRKKNPVERMTAFINDVQTENIFTVRINEPVRDMFTYIAPHLGFPLNFIFSNLRLFGPLIVKIMPKLNPLAKGLISTTCSFTKIEGSSASKKCTATAYFQPVDAEDFQKDKEAFREKAREHGIILREGELDEYHDSADITGKGFSYLKKCIEEVFPDCPVVPYPLPSGGTDARHLRAVCPAPFRFAPLKITNKQLGLVHQPDENLDSSCLTEAVGFYKHFIKNYK
ncbi:MAG: M20/M25/M40 family metallo-hydrolase [Clostridia bacterium]|nr:M20/M25/M40 family metallo-hydrolase [Clostridia bacterium]